MDLPTILREARRRRGLSIRAAALRCDVPHSTWADWEAGTSSPSVERLAPVLRAMDLDLALTDPPAPEPPGERRVARHLRQSLTTRGRLALGDQLERTLAACGERPRLLTGPAAVGVWVPHVVARGPLPLPPAPTSGGHVELRLDEDEPSRRAAYASVATPAVLISEGAAETWPMLEISARLMADRGRDAAGRRLPPHRDADEGREARDLSRVLRWAGTGRLPVEPTDSRVWRLDAPPTLDALLLREGLPPRNTSRRPGQPP